MLWGILNFLAVSSFASEHRVFAKPTLIAGVKLQTWANVDPQSRLKSIGVLIPAADLEKLSDRPFEAVLKLPSSINTKPFRHIGINWEVNGHPTWGLHDASF